MKIFIYDEGIQSARTFIRGVILSLLRHFTSSAYFYHFVLAFTPSILMILLVIIVYLFKLIPAGSESDPIVARELKYFYFNFNPYFNLQLLQFWSNSDYY